MTAINFPDNPQIGDAFLNFAWDGEKWRNAGGRANALVLKDLFEFSVAADDSTQRTISTGENIKFTGAGTVTTASDAEGNITITGAATNLTGYATETFVTTRGYLTSIGTISYNDLTDKPNLAGTYTFNVAADDSTLRTISSEETVKFIGANGITTSSDAEGAITITASSSLIKGNLSVVLNTDGSMTFPSNRIDGGANTIALWSSNQSSLVWRGEGGAGLPLQSVVQAREGLVNIGTTSGILSGAQTNYSWQFNTSGQMTFPDSTVQTTAWTGTTSSLVNSTKTVSLGSDGVLTLPANGNISVASGNLTLGDSLMIGAEASLFSVNETGLYFGGQNSDAGTYIQIPGRTASENGEPLIIAHQWDNTSIDIQGGSGTWSFGTGGTLSLPNNGKISSGVNTAPVGSSFAYALNAFGAGSDTGGVFLPSDTNSRAIVAGYTLVSNTGVTLTVTSISIVAGTPNFVSVSTTPTASAFLYPVTVYSADYVAGYTAPEWQFSTNGSLTFPNGTTQTTAAESFSFSVAADDSTQRAISNNELIKFIGAGGITTASDAEGAITITQSAAAAGTLTGNTLASGVTASSLTSVGTLRQLAVTGAVTADLFNTDQITVVGNRIATTVTNANLELEPNGTGNITISTGTIVGTQTTQNVFNTTATTVNFAGAATTLNIGTSSGIVNIASAVKSGTGTFTKSGYATGDILLDNGGTDSPGVLMYYGNNNNFGIDSYNGTFSVLSGQLIRVTNNLNESGGAVKAAIDTSGNLATTGFIYAGAWRAGQVIRDTMLNNSEFTVNNTTVATSTTDTTLLTYSYTPTSSSSYLIIHVHVADYRAASDTGGAGTDSYFSRIKVDDAEIVYSRQMTRSGEGFRTGSLFPLTGRYTNSDTTAKTITVGVRRDSADDSITVTSSATALTLRITEIAR